MSAQAGILNCQALNLGLQVTGDVLQLSQAVLRRAHMLSRQTSHFCLLFIFLTLSAQGHGIGSTGVPQVS